MAVEDKINEIGEELNLGKIDINLVNNVAPKPEEFGEPSRRNIYFIRSRYIQVGRITNFSLGLSQGKLQPLKKLTLLPSVKQNMSVI